MSDISQVFKADDILTLSDDITGSERRGFGEKMGIISPAPSSVFLSNTEILDSAENGKFLMQTLIVRSF